MANPYFNAAYYLAQNPDLVRAGFTVDNVEQHYLQYGAAESVNNTSRWPNPWFNADVYLRANPDLIAAGLTLADALAHYAAFGVYEGRVFSNKPELNPANFDAKAYANANPDVVTVLGIQDINNLTAREKGALLGHFQAYGVNEGRATGAAGAALDFVNATLPAAITVKEGVVTLGTSGNDVFALAKAENLKVYSVNGLEGVDTVKIADVETDAAITVQSVEKLEITAAADAKLTVNGTGVQSVTFNNTGDFTYVGAKVDTVTLNTGGKGVIGQFTAASVAGKEDVLAVNAPKTGGASLTVNGIEKFNLAIANDVAANAGFALNANSVDGSALTVVLTGGKAGVGYAVTVDSDKSGGLETVTIDGSAALGNQTLQLEAANGAKIATIAGLKVTTIGGTGSDKLVANVGIDTLTGNAGADTFEFKTGTAAFQITTSGDKKVVSGVDTITDFRAGADAATSDKISLAGAKIATGDYTGIGTVDANGVLTFDTNYTAGKGLYEILDALDGVGDTDDTVLFNFNGDAYVFQRGATTTAMDDDALIKLTGVDAAKLKVVDDAIEFAVFA